MNSEFNYIKLSELVYDIENVLSDNFQNKTFWIVAETSDVKKYDDRRYCFIKLIEKEGSEIVVKMDAVIWWQHYELIDSFEYTTGKSFTKNLELLIKVKVSFSAKFGSLNLEIVDISFQYTLGKLELERKEILSRLVAENPEIISLVDGEYQTFNKSHELPVVIQNIALISAPNSDGLNDFIHEIETNKYGYEFNIDKYLTQIQGQNADKKIIDQLKLILTSSSSYDVIVIARGGGSQTDFSSFDTYEIGKEIAGVKIPVLTGIGHERNISIADLMSHTSVKTPTKAAAYIIDQNTNFENSIENLKLRFFDNVRFLLDEQNEILNFQVDKFINNTKLLITSETNKLEKLSLTIKYLNPENILSRGYAVLFHNEKILLNPSTIKKGDIIKSILKDTVITTETIKKEKKDESKYNL